MSDLKKMDFHAFPESVKEKIGSGLRYCDEFQTPRSRCQKSAQFRRPDPFLPTGYFPSYMVDRRPVSIVADARFLKGFSGLIPSAAKLIKSDTAAITLGLYNIHYNNTIINLVSPTWDALGVIVEEVSHGEQFIEMWQNLPDVVETNRLGGQRTRRPDHDEALRSWYIKYGAASAKAVVDGLHSYYGNSYEQDAQAKRASVMADLASKYPSQSRSKQKLCP